MLYNVDHLCQTPEDAMRMALAMGLPLQIDATWWSAEQMRAHLRKIDRAVRDVATNPRIATLPELETW